MAHRVTLAYFMCRADFRSHFVPLFQTTARSPALRQHVFVALVLSALSTHLDSPACAQCAFVWHAQNSGPNGFVYASASWDPDGPGPQQPWLILGGEFAMIGDLTVNHIAAWDGTEWHDLGGGVSDNVYANVYALGEYNGELIAGGTFTMAGTTPVTRIARWNGVAWQAISNVPLTGVAPDVRALFVHNNNLIVGGWFSTPGGSVVGWNGVNWLYMGDMQGIYPFVNALGTYQNQLFAAGYFTTSGGVTTRGVARWNGGQSWSACQNGMGGNDPNVRAVAEYNSEFIVGGDFITSVGGGAFANHVARWNGASWSRMSDGFTGIPDPNPYVYALAIYNGELFAAGGFTKSGTADVRRVGRWNGANWLDVAGGANALLRTMTVFRNSLVVAGDLTEIGNGNSTQYWARWGPSCPTGDMNCDQSINTDDIPDFAAALLDPDSLSSCLRLVADVNYDGLLNGSDISPFLAALQL